MSADPVCVRVANVELTYAHVGRRVEASACQFAAVGVGRGDVLAIMLPNRVELLIELMAA
jgi:long-chain acyl-CoA synthetase